jgi:hypothetical protein
MAVTVPDQSTPYTHDLLIRRGNSFLETFTFTDRDLTGYTFKCEVRDIYDRRLIFSCTPILSSTNIISIAKSQVQTVVRAGRYGYDLSIIDADDDTSYDVVCGIITLEDDITLNVADPLEDEDGEGILT